MRRDPGPHRRQGRLLRGPAGVRRDRPAQGQQAESAATSPRRTWRRAGTSSSCAPPTPASTRSARRSPSRRSRPAQPIDVTGKTKGKGFAGVMKRHGFHGLRASHGVERKHRSPGSIGACATPGRVFKGVRMAGRMGGVRFTVQNLTDPGGRHRAEPDPGPGRDPRPQGRAGAGPHRGQEQGEEGRCGQVTTVDVLNVEGANGRLGRAAGRHLRRAGQHPADAPGRGGPARRGPAGHAQGEDPRRGRRRRQEAVQAEGHRSRPAGLDPRAAVHRRWRRARPGAARLQPADPEEDEGRRPARRPLRPGPRRAACTSSRRFVDGETPSTKAALATLRKASPRRAGSWSCSSATDELNWLSLRNVPTVHLLEAGQLNTYDVLVADEVVFTKDALDEFLGVPAETAEEDEQVSTIADPRDIIVAPVVSEKSYSELEPELVHVPGPPGREQDRDQDRDPADLQRPRPDGEHAQPRGQAQAHPDRLGASARTPSGRW